MSSSFNKIILLGYLCSDWELRFTPKGTAVAKCNIAVNRTWKTDSGEKREDVAFVPLEVWAGMAETLAKFTRKGYPLLIEGRVAQENWEDKTTHQKRSKLKVILESFSFVKSKDGGGDTASDPASRPRNPSEISRDAAPQSDAPPEEENIPF